MTQDEVKAGVIECVAQSLAKDAAQIDRASRLIPDLGADSLDFIDIMFSLERKFDIKLQKEDFELISRLGMPREEAVVDGKLTLPAKQKLRKWLTALPLEGDLMPKDLGAFVTIETLMVIVEEFRARPKTAPAWTTSPTP
jgi:acyl carrier protein